MSKYVVDSTELTAIANAIRAKSGGSGSLAFSADFISEIGNISGGGESGAAVVASGTFVGNGDYTISVSVGKKMPQTDFIFKFWVDAGTEFAYDTYYKFADCALVVLKGYASYDLSSDGTKSPLSSTSVNVNNDGTITSVAMRPVFFVSQTVRNAAIGATVAATQPTSQKVVRNTEGFKISLTQGNSTYKFVSGMTFNWQLLYIGDSPTTDIVEVE